MECDEELHNTKKKQQRCFSEQEGNGASHTVRSINWKLHTQQQIVPMISCCDL